MRREWTSWREPLRAIDHSEQYLRALFEACSGDLGRMAQELLGPKGAARQVHLRLNQLGLRLRDMRKTA